MKLTSFITEHMDEILSEWEAFASTLEPAAGRMSVLALRDHAKGILQAIVLDIATRQNPEEQMQKSQGLAPDDLSGAVSAASIHGTMRHDSNFSLIQLSGEFRALRATVLAAVAAERGHAVGRHDRRNGPLQRGDRPGTGRIRGHLFGARRANPRAVPGRARPRPARAAVDPVDGRPAADEREDAERPGRPDRRARRAFRAHHDDHGRGPDRLHPHPARRRHADHACVPPISATSARRRSKMPAPPIPVSYSMSSW